MPFDELVWKAQHGSPALEEENPRGAMAPGPPARAAHRGHDPRRGPSAARPAGAHEDELTDLYALGRSSWGVSYEQIAVEYEGGELTRAQLRRT